MEIPRRTISIVLVIALFAVSILPVLANINAGGGLKPDFSMLWTGGRFAIESPHLIYDADAMTRAQAWIRANPKGPMPFIYPPTAVFLVLPFGLLPFWPSYFAWNLLSAAFFFSAVRKIVGGWAAPVSFLSPHVVVVLLLGQSTLWSGGAVLWSLVLLRDRPFLAGLFMGLAAAIKPQAAFLAPLLFLADRNWRAMAGAAATWGALALASLLFGPERWLEWLHDLGTFQSAVMDPWGVTQYGATPTMAARTLGLPIVPVAALGAAAGGTILWFGWRSPDLHTRILAFGSASILISPYAMSYELAMLAPVFATGLLSVSLRGLLIGAPILALNSLTAIPALLVSNAAAVAGRARPLPSRNGRGE